MPYHAAMRTPTNLGILLIAGLSSSNATAQVLDTDVPFVISPPAVTEAMLKLARVGPNDFVIDLGSGDGRIVILAAKKHGARGLGVEIDPRLVAESRANAQKAGVAAQVEFRNEDLFKTDLARATVITMYLLPDVNMLLRPRLLALKPGTRIVSHDWHMGDWGPDEEVTIPVPEKARGVHKSSRVMRWTVPARIDGLWCANVPDKERLAIRQAHQTFVARLESWPPLVLNGRLDGARMRFDGGGSGVVQGAGLRLTLPHGHEQLSGTWQRCP